jgi:Membrane bound beta barrel domain (DUF5777)
VRQIINLTLVLIATFSQAIHAQTDSVKIETPTEVLDTSVANLELDTADKASIWDPELPNRWGIGLRIINGHSIYTLPKGKLEFCIQHRFGLLNQGKGTFYGLDESNIRLGFDYGLFDNLTIGIARTSMGKMFNGYGKLTLTKQGPQSFISAAVYSDIAVSAVHKDPALDPWYFTHRLRYTNQLILSHIFGNQRLMVQLAPTVVHRNLVDSLAEPNDLVLLASSMRLRVTKKMSITGEYHYLFHNEMRKLLHPCVGAGIEIYTGGHVFQMVFTNASALMENQYMSQTNGNIANGDLRFGFNIVRRF